MKRKKIIEISISLIICILLILADQYIKHLILTYVAGKNDITIIPGIFSITYVENRGAAFGIMQNRLNYFIVLTVICTIAIIYCYIKIVFTGKFRALKAICIFILAGSLGNFADRLFRGYVVDMFYFHPFNFPVFNVADCYITVSSIAFIVFVIFIYKNEDFSFLNPFNAKRNKTHE